MNPRNLTREAIEQSNDVEPYCFETDREEQWFNVGLQYGLDVADSDPISPWISVDEDLPCNHEELLSKEKEGYTESVMAYTNIGVIFISMRKYNDGWKWETSHYFPRIIIITHWMPIPELPKE